MDPSLYKVDAVSEPGRIKPVYGTTWPSHREDYGAVIVRFVAGYGLAAAVPQALKNWILLEVGSLNDIRESMATGVTVTEINTRWTASLLDDFVIPREGI
jgi:hypothetical protein